MINYNERLDEVLASHGAEEGEFTESLKQAITSLIKELVAEAKPTMAIISDSEMGIDRARKSAANIAINQFEQNLLKALETL